MLLSGTLLERSRWPGEATMLQAMSLLGLRTWSLLLKTSRALSWT